VAGLLSGRVSSGVLVDSVLDRLPDAALLAGLALAAGLDTSTWAALAAALFGSLQVPYVRASYEASFGQPFPPSASRLGVGRDVRLLLVAVSAVALQPFAGLLAVALLANLEVAHRLAQCGGGGRSTSLRRRPAGTEPSSSRPRP
jgi:phosphatidylglycerophosphate synthase